MDNPQFDPDKPACVHRFARTRISVSDNSQDGVTGADALFVG
jgi:hypothetical protein